MGLLSGHDMLLFVEQMTKPSITYYNNNNNITPPISEYVILMVAYNIIYYVYTVHGGLVI